MKPYILKDDIYILLEEFGLSQKIARMDIYNERFTVNGFFECANITDASFYYIALYVNNWNKYIYNKKIKIITEDDIKMLIFHNWRKDYIEQYGESSSESDEDTDDSDSDSVSDSVSDSDILKEKDYIRLKYYKYSSSDLHRIAKDMTGYKKYINTIRKYQKYIINHDIEEDNTITILCNDIMSKYKKVLLKLNNRRKYVKRNKAKYKTFSNECIECGDITRNCLENRTDRLYFYKYCALICAYCKKREYVDSSDEDSGSGSDSDSDSD